MTPLARFNCYTDLGGDWSNLLVPEIRHLKILELFAGNGSLAKYLQKEGCDIYPTDNFSWSRCEGVTLKRYTETQWLEMFGWWKNAEVENLDALKAVDKYGSKYDALLMSWPPNKPVALESLKAMSNIKVFQLIFLGELNRCGCKKFRKTLYSVPHKIVYSHDAFSVSIHTLEGRLG